MKIIFAGTPEFAAKALAAVASEHQVLAVLTQPDRPSGRGMRLTPSPVKQYALENGLPVMQPASLKSHEIQQELAGLEADAMVVAAYGLILPLSVLSIPRYGCLNIHASLLPRWRGAAPIQRAIQAGDEETGITIMQMDEGLDTGDMLLKRACRIEGADTAQTLHDKLAVMGAECIVEALRAIQTGSLTAERQDNSIATYAAKLQKGESRLDWQKDAMQLAREVRAFNPFPVSHMELQGVPVKVWQAAAVPQQGKFGTVLAADKHGLVVACGKDALKLEMLQRPGGKAQPAAQFLQAMPVDIGMRLA